MKLLLVIALIYATQVFGQTCFLPSRGPLPTLGQACTLDTPPRCMDGLTCINDFCVYPYKNMPCTVGTCGALSCTSGTCQPTLLPGDSGCGTSGATCGFGAQCTNGVCVGLSEGQTCQYSQQCNKVDLMSNAADDSAGSLLQQRWKHHSQWCLYSTGRNRGSLHYLGPMPSY